MDMSFNTATQSCELNGKLSMSVVLGIGVMVILGWKYTVQKNIKTNFDGLTLLKFVYPECQPMQLK